MHVPSLPKHVKYHMAGWSSQSVVKKSKRWHHGGNTRKMPASPHHWHTGKDPTSFSLHSRQGSTFRTSHSLRVQISVLLEWLENFISFLVLVPGGYNLLYCLCFLKQYIYFFPVAWHQNQYTMASSLHICNSWTLVQLVWAENWPWA